MHTPSSRIAPLYDPLNHLFTCGTDTTWRRILVTAAHPGPNAHVLDVCTETGDLAIEFGSLEAVRTVTGVDFSEKMLARARAKALRRGLEHKVSFLRGDALALLFSAGSFDVVSMGFGLRNLLDRVQGIREMVQVLCEGGRLPILEFAPPPAPDRRSP